MQRSSVAAIEQQISQLKNRLAQAMAREAHAERKRRSRQAIILGSWIMRNKPELAAAISRNALERDQDRAAFGLPPLEVKAGPPAKTETQVDVLLPIGEHTETDRLGAPPGH